MARGAAGFHRAAGAGQRRVFLRRRGGELAAARPLFQSGHRRSLPDFRRPGFLGLSAGISGGGAGLDDGVWNRRDVGHGAASGAVCRGGVSDAGHREKVFSARRQPRGRGAAVFGNDLWRPAGGPGARFRSRLALAGDAASRGRRRLETGGHRRAAAAGRAVHVAGVRRILLWRGICGGGGGLAGAPAEPGFHAVRRGGGDVRGHHACPCPAGAAVVAGLHGNGATAVRRHVRLAPAARAGPHQARPQRAGVSVGGGVCAGRAGPAETACRRPLDAAHRRNFNGRLGVVRGVRDAAGAELRRLRFVLADHPRRRIAGAGRKAFSRENAMAGGFDPGLRGAGVGPRRGHDDVGRGLRVEKQSRTDAGDAARGTGAVHPNQSAGPRVVRVFIPRGGVGGAAARLCRLVFQPCRLDERRRGQRPGPAPAAEAGADAV